jgi:hypothetical protein
VPGPRTANGKLFRAGVGPAGHIGDTRRVARRWTEQEWDVLFMELPPTSDHPPAPGALRRLAWLVGRQPSAVLRTWQAAERYVTRGSGRDLSPRLRVYLDGRE